MSRGNTRAPLSWRLLAVVQTWLLVSMLAFPALAIAQPGQADQAEADVQLYLIPEENSLTAGREARHRG